MTRLRSVSTTAFVLVLLLIGSANWVWSWVAFPHATLDQRILFRPEGDSDYLPEAAWLSHLDMREQTTLELAHTGVRSFPVAALVMHAGMIRLFGDAGFMATEILLFLLYGYLLSRLLQSAGVVRPVAEILAVVVVSGAANLMVANISKIIGSFPLIFWSARFPRPSVTELFVLILLMILIRLTDRSLRAGRATWLALGVMGGCLLQADIYPAIALAMATAILAAYLMKSDFRYTCVGLGLAAAGAAAATAPFLYQRMHELPDVPRRWGMFALSGHHWILFTPLRLFVIIPVVLLIALAYCFRSGKESRARVRTTAGVMGIVMVVSSLAGPLQLFLTGKGIQLYHHSVASEILAGYGVLICAGWILQEILGRSGILFRRSVLAPASAIVFAACLAVAAWTNYQDLGRVWWGRTQPAVADPRIRNRFDRAEQLRYRTSFNELHAVLDRPDWRQAQVLGTFDGELANWWEYRQKHLYLPDLFNTTIADGEIESRVYSFMHLLGATPEDFGRALDHWYFVFRVLAGAKYQANRMFTPWPLQDYSADARARIQRLSILDETIVQVPEPEKARLMQAYIRFNPLQQPTRRLDLVVLSTGDLRAYVHPEKSSLKLLWKNPVFEIWAPGNSDPASRKI